MTRDINEDLSLDELARTVQRELSERGWLDAQPDGRVAPAPDARTVRYYTTLGLLDRPRIVDRQARYGRRHVVQLLAIKALQRASLPLAQIQARLYGINDEELTALVASAATGAPAAAIPDVRWRELLIAPGLRLQLQEGWTPGADSEALIERIRGALERALREHGGSLA